MDWFEQDLNLGLLFEGNKNFINRANLNPGINGFVFQVKLMLNKKNMGFRVKFCGVIP